MRKIREAKRKRIEDDNNEQNAESAVVLLDYKKRIPSLYKYDKKN